MNRAKLTIFVSSAIGLAMFACGGISDPTRESSLSLVGTLTGTSVPSDAHVALIWRVGRHGGVVVGADAPVVNGRYSVDIAVPPDNYFFSEDSQGGTGSPGTGGNTGTPASWKFAAQSQSTGGQVTEPLSRAIAGFLVYVDGNGNGKLDPDGDRVIGGDRQLFVTYLRGGGSLAYEKLRDKTGAVPQSGFNLGWTEGWLQFDNADLTLSDSATLPPTVCAGSPPDVISVADAGGSGGGNPGTPPRLKSLCDLGYPSCGGGNPPPPGPTPDGGGNAAQIASEPPPGPVGGPCPGPNPDGGAPTPSDAGAPPPDGSIGL